MKIVHICMCDSYAEGWAYHRNITSEQNSNDGHQVSILTTVYTMDSHGKPLRDVQKEYTNSYGIKVIRLPNKFIYNDMIQSRLRLVKGLYKVLEKIEPDIIMIHNPQFYSLLDVTKYKRRHSNVLLLGDSHADYIVSGRNWFSKYILNGVFYRGLIKSQIEYFDRIYFITEDTKKFFKEMYTSKKIPGGEIIPLCSKYYSPEQKENYRIKIRSILGMPDTDYLLMHSGKLDARKKTRELLDAFYKVKTLKAKLVILGSIPEDMRSELMPRIERDERVQYLGWKTAAEISEYLCASDIYLQPGMHSVTLQNSLSCGTPVMVAGDAGYRRYYSGWEFEINNQDDIKHIFEQLSEDKIELKQKSICAYFIAEKYFDSRIFAKEMYRMQKQKINEKK